MHHSGKMLSSWNSNSQFCVSCRIFTEEDKAEMKKALISSFSEPVSQVQVYLFDFSFSNRGQRMLWEQLCEAFYMW